MIQIVAKPFRDEILSSWIIRSALAGGSDPLGWTYGLWDEWRGWTLDMDRFTPKEKLMRLAKASGIAYSKLYSMTLAPTVAYLSEEEMLFYQKGWRWVIPQGARNRMRSNGLHFCPECLAEKIPYLKKEWRLSWSTLCPRHHIQLLLHCPQCHQIFSPHLIGYDTPHLYLCSRCGFDLRKATPISAHDTMVSLHHILRQGAFMHAPIQEHFIYPLATSSPIEVFLFIRDCMRLLYNIHRQPRRYLDLLSHIAPHIPPILFKTKVGTTIDAIKNEQRYHLLHIAAAILSMDSDTFIALLKKSGISRNTFINTIGSPDSVSMQEVRDQLPNNSRDRAHSHSAKEIEPLMPKEVEKLMDEIREYL